MEEKAQKRAEEQAKENEGALDLNGLRSIYNSLNTPDALLVRPKLKSSYDEEQKAKAASSSDLSAIDRAIKPISQLSSPYSLIGFKYVPTRNEKKRWAAEWEQASRFAQGHSMMEIRDKAAIKESEEEMERQRQEDNTKYENLKNRLGMYTVAISLALSADAYYQFGTDTAFSFGVGSIGSLIYLRLLSSKVDIFGGGGDIIDAISPPSMTAPIIHFMLHDRFNELYSARFGMELLGLPLLLGFLTYKASTILQVFFDLQELEEQAKIEGEEEEEEVFRGVDIHPGFKNYDKPKPAFGAWD